MKNKLFLAIIALMCLISGNTAFAEQETLPLLRGNVAPQTFDDLWAGYDPCAEPLGNEKGEYQLARFELNLKTTKLLSNHKCCEV